MKKIEGISILVVGDIMLDHYILGDVERISPEAPVPVVNVTKDIYSLGGCGNVVRNLAELGVQTTCMATIGHDNAGTIIWTKLVNINCRLIQLPNDKITTQKIRIIGGETQTQMLRIDREDTSPTEYNEWDVYDESYGIIVVADYGKGVVTRGLMDKLHAMDTPIIVDPYPDHAGMYGRVFMITPNKKEWDKMTSTSLVENNFENILITKGKDGMELSRRIGGYTKDSETWHSIYIKDEPVPVYNVSGAGDAVVAVMATCIAEGIDIETSARIANKCAGYVVTQPGTSIVPKELFMEILGGVI